MQTTPLRILLADDDEDDRAFFERTIQEMKMETTFEEVKDGVELMDHLNQPHVILPDIVFLDLNMPRKNGFQSLIEIKQNKLFKNIIIAIYSTSSSESDIEATFVNGANIYIQKPEDYISLKKILTHVININWQYHTSGLNREMFLLKL
jgi:CheY-like chemotaxis protein